MKTYIYVSSIAGLAGVVAGAFGAHMLKDTLLNAGALSTWNTAVLYHLIHVPAILAATLFAGCQTSSASCWLIRACRCWTLGILLFSGSLYALSLGGPRWLGPVTPLGGLFLITGWACLIGFESNSAAKINDANTR